MHMWKKPPGHLLKSSSNHCVVHPQSKSFSNSARSLTFFKKEQALLGFESTFLCANPNTYLWPTVFHRYSENSFCENLLVDEITLMAPRANYSTELNLSPPNWSQQLVAQSLCWQRSQNCCWYQSRNKMVVFKWMCITGGLWKCGGSLSCWRKRGTHAHNNTTRTYKRITENHTWYQRHIHEII